MIKKLFINTLSIIITSTLLTSCSNSYISTNLDKENFQAYFSASNVIIYDHEKEINGRYQYIGSVEGNACQIKPHHKKPDKINARTQARQQAFDQKANAIIFTGCITLNQEQLTQLNNSNDARQCHAVIICYAKAYALETKQVK